MADHTVEVGVVGEAAVPTVVSQHEERPEHGALRRPVERPHEPAVEARGGGGEPQHQDDVAQDVAHGAPGVLHPAVLGDGGADVGQPERWRRRGVKRRCFLSLGGGGGGGGGHSHAASPSAPCPCGTSTSTRRRRQHNASGDWDGEGEEQACHGGSPGPAAAPLPLPLPLKKKKKKKNEPGWLALSALLPSAWKCVADPIPIHRPRSLNWHSGNCHCVLAGHTNNIRIVLLQFTGNSFLFFFFRPCLVSKIL